ncbi:MAG TPA: hypothetical protein DEF42_01530 [Desulfosporosinus sp.]|nr:hypothetical protein [Desulfosporosinus sp.]
MKWEKKDRTLLGLASMLIGFLFIVLLKSNVVYGSKGVWQETSIPILIQINKENQQLSLENKKLKLEVEKYMQVQSTSDLYNQQLKEAKMNAGLISVTGPGLRITLDDSKRVVGEKEDPMSFIIHEEYIRDILNALWNGGAEAIAVNGQRIMANTEVFCSGSYIQINVTRQMPPYVIEVTGDVRDLSSSLEFYRWFQLGYLQQQNGITRNIEVLSKVVIPAGKLPEYHYAEPVKGDI